MPVRSGDAEWRGDLRSGGGQLSLGSGAFTGSYSFASRFEDDSGTPGTNPEELIAAAHAACYSMALANGLAQAGHRPESVRTTARVHLDRTEAGPSISRIDLRTRVRAPGTEEGELRAQAETAKAGCPVSRALAAVEITLEVDLER